MLASARHRVARDRPPVEQLAAPRARRLVRARRDRRRDRRRHRAHGRVVACAAPLPQRRARIERAPLRERSRRLGRGARRPAPRRATAMPKADSVAALFVAVIVLGAAVRLMRRNVDVLMDRAPADAEEAARAGDRCASTPSVELRRLRMRQAAGRHFADVVIGVSPDAAVGQGHAAADAVEQAVQGALPEADVVVHVEPLEGRRPCASARTRRRSPCRACARCTTSASSRSTAAPSSRSISSFPAISRSTDAHAIAEEVEHAIRDAVPEVERRADAPRAARRRPPVPREVAGDVATVRADRARRDRPDAAASCASSTPTTVSSRTSRFGSARDTALADAHARASEIEEEIRRRAARDRGRGRAHGADRVKLCMFSPADPTARAGMAGADRRRPGHPARGADAAGVLHRRRPGARARRVPARGRRLPRAGPPSAVGAHLRGRRLHVREPGRDPRGRRRRRRASRRCDDRPRAAATRRSSERTARSAASRRSSSGSRPSCPARRAATSRSRSGRSSSHRTRRRPRASTGSDLVAHAAANTRLFPGDLIAA